MYGNSARNAMVRPIYTTPMKEKISFIGTTAAGQRVVPFVFIVTSSVHTSYPFCHLYSVSVLDAIIGERMS